MGAVTLMARDASASSVDSMTDGSSASSNHSADDEAADQITPLPNALQIRGEEGDLVSPLSAVSMKGGGRFFDNVNVSGPSPSASPSVGSPSFGPLTPLGATISAKERDAVFSKTGLSPVVG